MASQERIKEAILRAGVWQFGEYQLGSGKEANNRFEMPLVLDNPAARRLLLPALCRLVASYSPDSLWGVPSGGQEFASVVGQQPALPVIQLQELGRGKELGIEYLYPKDRALATRAYRTVGLKDVIDDGTFIVRSLRLPELSEKTVAIVACWVRGILLARRSMLVKGVVEEPVPNLISSSHPFYQRYGHFAVYSEQTPA